MSTTEEGKPSDQIVTDGSQCNRRMDDNNNLWIPINSLNPHLICGLCQGYLYEACTITECMHSFCKNCIVKHLVRSLNCPVCAILIHPTDPFVHIRFDGLLQDIVYVLLPHVKKSEIEKEMLFYKVRPGELDERGRELAAEEKSTKSAATQICFQTPSYSQCRPFLPPISLCLQHLSGSSKPEYCLSKQFVHTNGGVTIKNVSSFLRKKLHVEESCKVDLYCPCTSGYIFLSNSHTLKVVKDLYSHDKDILQLRYDISEQ